MKTDIPMTIFSQSQRPHSLRRGYAPLACSDCGSDSPLEHGCMSLVIVVRVVRQRLLWRADHSSRGVLPIISKWVWSRNLNDNDAYNKPICHYIRYTWMYLQSNPVITISSYSTPCLWRQMSCGTS